MSDDIRSSHQETESLLRMARESSSFYEGLARALETHESQVTSEKPAKPFIFSSLQPIRAQADVTMHAKAREQLRYPSVKRHAE